MVNFICSIFITRLIIWISGGFEIATTSSYVANSIFGLKHWYLAYRFDVVNVGLSSSDDWVQFSRFSAEAFGWPGGTDSGSWESVGPLELEMEVVGCSGSEHVGTVRARPVNPRGWRRIRWSKRRGIVASHAGLGLSVGGARVGVEYGILQGRNVEEAFRHSVGIVDADVLVDGECVGTVILAIVRVKELMVR